MDRSEGAGGGQLLSEVGDALESSSLFLTFGPEAERRYRAFTDASRNAHYLRVSATSLIVYNLFLLADHQMMADVFWLAVVLQIGVASPVSLVTLFIMRSRPALGQPVLLITLTLVTACSMAIYTQSRTPGALLMPFAFPNVFITANIVFPLRFNLALPFTVLSAAMMVAFIGVHPGYGDGMKLFTLINVVGAGAFTVFAAYRMETSDRRAFLLSLRETLRAETLANDNDHLRTLAGTDGLTQIGNRRFFDATLELLWREALVAGEPLGLLLLDVDHFKALNDRHGHQAGDHCLALIGAILREYTRDDRDCAARYGGEEFAVLLPKAGLKRVQEVAERLREAVEAAQVALSGPAAAGALHVSVGCAAMIPRQGAGAAALIEAADAALYAAKRAGRNRIHPPVAGAALVAIRAAAQG